MTQRGRRIITIETLDVGGIARASGDAGMHARVFLSDAALLEFVTWYLAAEPVDGAADAVSFQMPAMTMFEAVALEPKDPAATGTHKPLAAELMPTDTQVRRGKVKTPRPVAADSGILPAQGTPRQEAETQIIPAPRWSRRH